MKGGGESLQRGDGHDLTLSGRTLPQSGSRIARFRISWATKRRCPSALGVSVSRDWARESACEPALSLHHAHPDVPTAGSRALRARTSWAPE